MFSNFKCLNLQVDENSLGDANNETEAVNTPETQVAITSTIDADSNNNVSK